MEATRPVTTRAIVAGVGLGLVPVAVAYRLLPSETELPAVEVLQPLDLPIAAAALCAWLLAAVFLDGADVVMVLRIQRERLAGALLPSLREYARTYGIGPGTLARAKPDAIVMHPGPMNRGVEIENVVADGERSVVLEQVEAGVAVRMALLYMFAGESSEPLAVGEVD